MVDFFPSTCHPYPRTICIHIYNVSFNLRVLDHFTLQSVDSEPAYLKTFLGDEIKLNYTDAKLSQVITEFDVVANVIGSSSPISNIKLYFVDAVLRPPRTLSVIAKQYNWTAAVALLNNLDKLDLSPISKENTL